jgi:hypothetical protein
MTVGELQERMTPEEMVLWNGYYSWRHEEREKAERKASWRR